jgi:hypothetical protein
VEVARGDGRGGGLDHPHADLGIADTEIIDPALPRRAGAGKFGQHAECGNIERRAFWCHLLEALVVGVVAEADGARAQRDAGRLVVGGVADAAAQPRGPWTRWGTLDRSSRHSTAASLCSQRITSDNDSESTGSMPDMCPQTHEHIQPAILKVKLHFATETS